MNIVIHQKILILSHEIPLISLLNPYPNKINRCKQAKSLSILNIHTIQSIKTPNRQAASPDRIIKSTKKPLNSSFPGNKNKYSQTIGFQIYSQPETLMHEMCQLTKFGLLSPFYLISWLGFQETQRGSEYHISF